MNKSEELCKLLGIEPKCLAKIFEPKMCGLAGCKECGMYEKLTCKGRYPDLTKPSNFVKLLKIHPKGTICFYATCEPYIYGAKTLEIDIINVLIEKIFPKLINRQLNTAKKQAQQTEWEY